MMDFWTRLDGLLASHEIVIDRPKGSRYPNYPEIEYPLDYGYLKDTSGGDGNEIDVWRGSQIDFNLVAVACTVDSMKSDAEMKLLIGCTDQEVSTIDDFYNSQFMSAIIIHNNKP